MLCGVRDLPMPPKSRHVLRLALPSVFFRGRSFFFCFSHLPQHLKVCYFTYVSRCLQLLFCSQKKSPRHMLFFASYVRKIKFFLRFPPASIFSTSYTTQKISSRPVIYLIIYLVIYLDSFYGLYVVWPKDCVACYILSVLPRASSSLMFRVAYLFESLRPGSATAAS
jgi:hypothetical protein